jgi:DNA polymerase-3 subunit gamma/tau
MLDVADAMDERSLSFDSALQELATQFHRIALLQFAPQAMIDDAERARLAPYAAAFDAEFLQLCYQIAIHGRDEIGLAPDEYSGFAMTLLRLFAFRPDAGAPLATGVAKAPTVAPARPQPAAAPSGGVSPRLTFPEQPASGGSNWHDLVARLALSGLPRQLAQHCELVEMGESQVTLRLPPAHKSLLNTKAPQEKLQEALQAQLGRPVKLNFVFGEAEGETPAARASNEKRERQEKAVAAIEGDPFVRDVMDIFDANIDESTIKPV